MASAQEYTCKVQDFRMVTPTVFELRFDVEQPLEFKAGQFVSIIIPGAGPKGRDLRRAYSIASSPHIRPIELCIKLVEGGPGTTYLGRLRPGDTFKAYAPYGDFVYKTQAHRRACFIATGTGVAPFRAIAQSEAYRAAPPLSAHCLLGVRTEDELLYMDEMANIPGLIWVPTVSQPKGSWNGRRGRVTDYLRELGSDFPWLDTEYYLCGNGDMITEVKALLTEKGVEKSAIHQEKYY